jgi:gluconate kinase
MFDRLTVLRRERIAPSINQGNILAHTEKANWLSSLDDEFVCSAGKLDQFLVDTCSPLKSMVPMMKATVIPSEMPICANITRSVSFTSMLRRSRH